MTRKYIYNKLSKDGWDVKYVGSLVTAFRRGIYNSSKSLNGLYKLIYK